MGHALPEHVERVGRARSRYLLGQRVGMDDDGIALMQGDQIEQVVDDAVGFSLRRLHALCGRQLPWTWSAFRPGPGRYPPPVGELAKRHCKYCAGLRDLLAAQLERHRCGNDHIGAVAGDVVVQGLAQRDEIIRSAMLLTLNQHISVPILRRCWPLPDVRGHPVKDRPRDSESRRHHRRITSVEGIDVLAHCCHRIVCHRVHRVIPSHHVSGSPNPRPNISWMERGRGARQRVLRSRPPAPRGCEEGGRGSEPR